MQSTQPVSSADELSDLELAGQIREASPAAFEAVMRRHNRRLFRLARSMLRNDADAQDALQDAYVLAFRSIAAFRGDCSLITWLSRIVANECLARQRREARRDNIVRMVSADAEPIQERVAMISADTESPDDALARAQVRALLERKLDELPQALRSVFMLRCVEELSTEETAQCLDIPEATVRTRQFRARSMLRESLASDFDLAERDVFSFDGARCDRIVLRVLQRLQSADA
ncbi:MAG TPA: RNA polymerase sigma factor [Ramlibacter sp.]|nr:RNA polymerase sigma factor [Ramlibacter sp.]